jgi:hypothetical protein
MDLKSNVRALNCRAVGQVFGKDRDGFNCWGFTAFMQGWISKLKWIDCDTMIQLLEENSIPIDPKELVPGDIAVYEDDNYLEHTAVITDPLSEEFIHKPGACALEMQNFDNTLGKHKYGKISEFRRSKTNWNLGCT